MRVHLGRRILPRQNGERATSDRGSTQTDRKMFEARHSMDAPTTTSADSGSGGGGGWFTPRKAPPAGASTDQETPSEGRKVTPIRPVGRPGRISDDPAETVPTQSAAPAAEATPAPQY